MRNTKYPSHPPRVTPALQKLLYHIETSPRPPEEKKDMREAWSFVESMLRSPADADDPQLPGTQDPKT